MKKMKTTIQTLAALLMAVAGTMACSSGDDIASEPTPATTETPKTYTMTVIASKGDDATTRALSLDGKTLNATWAKGEKVDVYTVTSGATYSDPAVYTKVGTLTASADGATATLTGTVTFSGKPRLELYYGSPSWTYEGQKGTLADISANYDYAMVALSASKYNITDGVITPNTSPLSFTNLQTIVKFSLKDSDGNAITAGSLTLKTMESRWFYMTYNHETGAYYSAESFTVTPTAPASEFFVAMRNLNKFALRLETTVGMYDYTYDKAEVTFDAGKYYEVSVKMQKTRKPSTINLATVSGDLTLIDGDVLTGTLGGGHKISIADGAAVTLSYVTISGGDYDDKPWAGITCLGNATITLNGTNSVKGYHNHYPGIQAGGSGTTLTIEGSGKLTATCGAGSDDGYGAGIGGGKEQAVGNIVIADGEIYANGGMGAGIGSGYAEKATASCGNITISGGNVRAWSYVGGAGIGSGSGNNETCYSSCGNITISGGTVQGRCLNYGGAGIGSGSCDDKTGGSRCGNIAISGGDIIGIGGTSTADTKKLGGAGIGTGKQAWCGNITINGTATGWTAKGENNFGTCYDIGTGYNGLCYDDPHNQIRGTVSVASGTISGTIGVQQ